MYLIHRAAFAAQNWSNETLNSYNLYTCAVPLQTPFVDDKKPTGCASESRFRWCFFCKNRSFCRWVLLFYVERRVVGYSSNINLHIFVITMIPTTSYIQKVVEIKQHDMLLTLNHVAMLASAGQPWILQFFWGHFLPRLALKGRCWP